MRYPLTFYVTSLSPDTAGEARGPIIRILRGREADEGLYQHELTHVKQWAAVSLLGVVFAAWCVYFGRMDLIGLSVAAMAVHSLLYTLVPAYRLWAEVQAYKRQASYYPDDRLPVFAGFICTSYSLTITHAAALALLIL